MSAAPDVLDALLSETSLRRCTVARLPITAPYHAPHLYGEDDIDIIFEGLGNGIVANEHRSSAIPIISSTDGKTIPPTPFPEALRIAVEHCLKNAIRWDLTAAGTASHIRSLDEHRSFTIQPIAITADGLGVSIQKLLGQSNLKISIPLTQPSPLTPPMSPVSPQSKSKIAIIGE